MKFKILILPVMILLTAVTVFAQKTWEKPFQKLSKEDTIKVLSQSPWVQEYQAVGNSDIDRQEAQKTQAAMSNQGVNPSSRGAGNPSDPGAKGRDLANPSITVRLFSGLPVRQAMVRMQEINAGYDKMDEQKRAEFDAKTKNTLDCPLCQKFYVVMMSKSVNTSNQTVEDGLFQTFTPEQFKGNIWLVNEKGDKQELAQFVPPKGAKDPAVFFFPRKANDGSDFIPAGSKSFKIVFDNDFLRINNPYGKFLPRNFEFKAANLRIGEILAF